MPLDPLRRCPRLRLFVSVLALAVVGWPSGGRVTAQAPAPGLQLLLQVNQPVLSAGATLRIGIGAINTGGAVPADFLWGVILPGGADVLQMTSGGLAPGSLNNLAGLHPVFSNLTVPGGFAQTLPDFFTYTLTGGEPPGNYRVYFAAIVPNALRDGRIDGGDVIAVEFRDFAIGAAPSVAVEPGQAATATILPAQGGEVQATAANGVRYTLRVPAGALLAPATITLTPGTLSGLPGGGSALATVQAAPSGLQFVVPATLTIAAPGGVPAGPLSALVTGEGGFEALPAFKTGPTTAVILGVSHFSTFALVEGSAFASSGAIAAVYLPLLSRAVDGLNFGNFTLAEAQAQANAATASWLNALELLLPASGAQGQDIPTRFAQTLEYANDAYVLDQFRSVYASALFGEATPAFQSFDLITIGPRTRARELARDLDAQCRSAQDLTAAEDYARAVWIGYHYTTDVRVDGTVPPLDPGPVLDFATAFSAPKLCVVPQITEASWPAIPTLGAPNPVQVRVGLSFAGAAPVFRAGVQVDIVGQNVAPGATSGVTDAAGRFTASLVPSNASHRLDITATMVGRALILADAQRAAASIIRSEVQGVTVTPPQVTLQPGQVQQFSATVAGTSNQSVTWAMSGTPLGTLSPSGLFTAGAAFGTVFVTATSVEDPSVVGVAQVTIGNGVSVTVSPSQVSLQPGQSQQFSAVVAGTGNQAVVWAQSGTPLGTLTPTGLFTAGQVSGTATVTATAVADATALGSAQVTIGSAPPCRVDLGQPACDYLPTFLIVCNPGCTQPSLPPNQPYARIRLTSATVGELIVQPVAVGCAEAHYALVVGIQGPNGRAFTATRGSAGVCAAEPYTVVSGTFGPAAIGFVQSLAVGSNINAQFQGTRVP